MNKERFGSVFPLGSHLCREPMPPMTELKRDMENLQRHGFNLIKLQENWAVDEPEEGQCDFSRYHELIGHAAKLDLGVYLGLTCEQAPMWLWEKHPGCRMVDREGKPVAYQATSTLPADGKPGPCYDHEGAREEMLRFVRALVQELGRHENIVVWNTWQEIGYWGEAFVGASLCYCPSTLAYFRSWLEQRYGDLDSLNRAWNTRHLSWAHVFPDMRPRGKTCQPHDADWNYFVDNVQVARVLEERCRVIKAADPLSRPVFAHKGAPAIGSGADWTYARTQDWLGSSCYPAWGHAQAWDDERPEAGKAFDAHDALLGEMADTVALRFDYLRSCNPSGRPVWAAEFQGGPICTGLHKGRVPSAADMRRWMLTALGSGASGISFWVTRAEIMAAEANGFSLLDSEGESTERYEEASRIGQALNRYPELFGKPTLDPSRVAILVNDWNWQLSRSLEGASEHLAYSTRGWHRLLWELGVPADFVEARHLSEDLRSSHVVVVPFPLSISEELVGELADFVRRGGTLVSEACIGRLSPHAYANRGELSPAARELFGVRQRDLVMVREPGDGQRWMPRERMWGEYRDAALLVGAGDLGGEATRANLYVQTFDCDGSEPALTYEGVPAGTTRSVGSGRAWLLGTLLGHSGLAYRIPQTRSLVRRLLGLSGVHPVHRGKLLVRRRSEGGRQALVITNPARESVTESILIPSGSKVRDLLEGPIDCAGEEATLTVPSLGVRVLVVER